MIWKYFLTHGEIANMTHQKDVTSISQSRLSKIENENFLELIEIFGSLILNPPSNSVEINKVVFCLMHINIYYYIKFTSLFLPRVAKFIYFEGDN